MIGPVTYLVIMLLAAPFSVSSMPPGKNREIVFFFFVARLKFLSSRVQRPRAVCHLARLWGAGHVNGTKLASAIAFFIYEGPKVLMLLLVVVFGVGIIRSFFTPERSP